MAVRMSDKEAEARRRAAAQRKAAVQQQKQAQQKKDAVYRSAGSKRRQTNVNKSVSNRLTKPNYSAAMHAPMDYLRQQGKKNTQGTRPSTSPLRREPSVMPKDKRRTLETVLSKNVKEYRNNRIEAAKAAQKNAKDRRSKFAAGQQMLDALYPVSEADRKLPFDVKRAVQRQKQAWDKGVEYKRMGLVKEGEEIQRTAHRLAEIYRAQRGYSGGRDGSYEILPDLDDHENFTMTDQAKKNLRAQKLFWAMAKQDDDKETMAQARENARNIRVSGSSYDIEKIKEARSGDPKIKRMDAHGKPIYTPTQWEAEGQANFFPAVGKNIAGSLLALGETAHQATLNTIRNRNDRAYQSAKTSYELWRRRAAHAKTDEERAAAQANADRAKARMAETKHNDAGNPYSTAQFLLKEANQHTRDVLDSLDGKGEKLLAQAGMSALQMAPALALAPLTGGAGSAALMGAMAAGQKAGELTGQGVSAQEALGRGLISGAIEGITEKIPIGNLVKMVKKSGGTSVIRNIAKQAGIEATEESASYVLNWAADKAAKDPYAQFSLGDLVNSAAVGAITGAGFGGVGSAIGGVRGALPVGEPSAAQARPEGPRPLYGNGNLPGQPGPIEISQQMDEARRANHTADGTDAVDAEDRTSVDADPETHTPEQMETIRAYTESVDDGLLDFAERYIENPNDTFGRYTISKVSERQASALEDAVGTDYSGYSNAINKNGINHISQRHGANGQADNSMREPADIARIGYILENFDSVYPLTDQNGVPVTSTEFRGKDNRPAPMVRFEKKINGSYYVVEAVSDNKYKKLWVVSAYISGDKNSGTVTQVLDAGDTAPSSQSSETPLASPDSTINSIPENAGTRKGTKESGTMPFKTGTGPGEPVGNPSGTTPLSETSIPETGETHNEKTADRQRFEEGMTEPRGGEGTAGEDRSWQDDAYLDSLVKTADKEMEARFATIPDPVENEASGPRPLYGNGNLPGERARSTPNTTAAEDTSQQDDAYLDSLLEAADREEEARHDQAVEKARGMVSARGEQDKTSLGQRAKEAGGFLYRKMVDSGDEIRKAGKQAGDRYLYAYFNQAKAATAAAQNMISLQQSDVDGNRVGESLAELFRPVKAKGDEYFEAFQSYLFHKHNVDRMGTPEDLVRAQAAKDALDEFDATHPEVADLNEKDLYELAAVGGDRDAGTRLDLLNEKRRTGNRVKPVFGYDVSGRASQNEAARLEGLHPEFKAQAEKIYQYTRNLLQYRVDSGLIPQELADKVQDIYPHYVPTYRTQVEEENQRLSKNVRVGKTMKRAEGGTGRLLPIDQAMAKQTMNTVRESAKNRFGRRLLNRRISGDYILDVKSEAAQAYNMDWEQVWSDTPLEKENTFTVYDDGKAYSITMTPEMFEGIQSLAPRTDRQAGAESVRVVRNANNLYKKLITAYNPVFTLKNVIKDFQDGLLYSTKTLRFMQNYFGPAIKEIATGGEYWRKYQALGGASAAASLYDQEQGVVMPKDGVWSKIWRKIESINLAAEQWPRMAEFMATVKREGESSDSLTEAMYNAAEITTNFSRSGKWGQMLNASFVPFLNPSIQGTDKLMRTFRDNDHTVKAWLVLTAKCASLGILPAVLNYLWAGDEEDYDLLRQSDKDLNYLFPLGDGKWLKIPRGRVLSVFSAMTNGGIRLMKGQDVGVIDILDTAMEQVGPVNPLTNNIAFPLLMSGIWDPDSPGKTWYGGDIESQRLQIYRPGERFDERTDLLSRKLGGALGLSPKKINYLLDAYTGVVGDMALPLLTPTNPVANGAAGRAFSPFTRSFALDSVTSNRLSQDFYEISDDLSYDKNDGDATSAVVSRWWGKVSGQVSELNQEIRALENDKGLPTQEKRDQIRALKKQVNTIMENAMDTLPSFVETAKGFSGNLDLEDDSAVGEAFQQSAWKAFGAEEALRLSSKDEYERAQKANQAGVSYETYLSYKKSTKGLKGDDARSATNKKLDILEKDPKTGKAVPEEEAAALWYTQILDSDGREKVDELESQGLPKLDYYRYKQAVKDLNGVPDSSNPGHAISGSKQEQRLPIINQMDLTKEQKDLLWFDNGWSEKTLYKKAPWH